MTGGQPLALRLALLLAASVTVVLLVAGLLVNRAVSRSLEETLNERQRAAIELAATLLDEAMQREGPLARRGIEEVLRRISSQANGTATLRDAAGQVVAEAGRLPPNAATEELTQVLPGGGTLEITALRRGEPFLRTFNAALVVAGALSVLVLVGVAMLAADRLTRPLRGVAAAARHLGRGDLGARAAGGPDRESRELAGAFNAMAERLERSEMLRRRAASDIAHDLATPATVLESQLQAMLDGVVPTDREQLEKSRASAEALSAVVRQLGDLARAEAAPLQRLVEPVDLRDLVREVADGLGALFRERDIRLAVELPDAPAMAELDAAQVGRALRNVLANAARHAPTSSRVTLRLSPAGPRHAIRIVDQGAGIAAEDLPHIFERFYRADPARGSRSAGAGIGLTIARELLAANGGSIEIETTGRAGTTVLIGLPAA